MRLLWERGGSCRVVAVPSFFSNHNQYSAPKATFIILVKLV